ncbi:hypothetical protein Goshw_002214, partial [Gossypium schwendimanii]|nr:hypothetical protein [Gossypium schwendimanii]
MSDSENLAGDRVRAENDTNGDPFRDYRDFCTKKVLKEIGNLVGTMANVDIKTNSGVRGQFARMAVFVDLEKSLTSQSTRGRKEDSTEVMYNESIQARTGDVFGPWMVVERKSRFTALSSLEDQPVGLLADISDLEGTKF